jgi:hypothetical protein
VVVIERARSPQARMAWGRYLAMNISRWFRQERMAEGRMEEVRVSWGGVQLMAFQTQMESQEMLAWERAR